jgi:hypothetical protein
MPDGTSLLLCSQPHLMGNEYAIQLDQIEGIELKECLRKVAHYSRNKDFGFNFCKYNGCTVLQRLAVNASPSMIAVILTSIRNLMAEGLKIPILESFLKFVYWY